MSTEQPLFLKLLGFAFFRSELFEHLPFACYSTLRRICKLANQLLGDDNALLQSEYVLEHACNADRADILAKLVPFTKNNFEPAFDSNKPIRLASQFGKLDVIQYLISLKPEWSGVSLFDGFPSAMVLAVENGHLHVLKYLFEFRNDEDFHFTNELLIIASESGKLDIMKYFLELDFIQADPSESAVLRVACEMGFLDIVEFLMSLNGKGKYFINPG